MNLMKCLTILAATSILGACSTSASWNPDEVRALPQKGDQFQQALHGYYVDRAQTEKDEGHWDAVSYFNIKARQASADDKVMPTEMNERWIPNEHVGELTDARSRLMKLLASESVKTAPKHTAYSQVMFDCWMEEQEENHQPADIAFCRDGFLTSLEQATASKQKMTKLKTAPITVYTVYFDHNSSKLDATAWTLEKEIIDQIKADKTKTVMVNGYTDRTGERSYNRILAEQRAATVVEMLEKSGIKSEINYKSFGEDRQEVQTLDGVHEERNRRVVITLE